MIKKINPTTSGQRKMSVTDYSILTAKKPQKSLTKFVKRSVGRDENGRISVRHKGGGAKRRFRLISSLNEFEGQNIKIEQIEYDPNRTSFIVLGKVENGKLAYFLAWEGAKVGDEITSADKTELKKGNRMRLKNIPNGVSIYDIELHPGQGGKIAKSAGNSTTIVAKEGKWVNLKMPSGEIRKVNKECFASIGQVSNITHSAQTIGKAGRKRHMGVRPSVRGKAMHPAAHPHGGGEGVNSIGLKYPKTPWGKHALGVRTRNKKKYSNKFILKRRRK